MDNVLNDYQKKANDFIIGMAKDVVLSTLSKIDSKDSGLSDQIKDNVGVINNIVGISFDKKIKGLLNINGTPNECGIVVYTKHGGLFSLINSSNDNCKIDDIEELSQILGNKYTEFVTNIKQSIVPAMKKCEEIIESSIPITDNQSDIKITTLTLPALFSNIHNSNITVLGNGSLPSVIPSIPVPPISVIRNMFITNSSDINHDVEYLLSSKSDEYLLTIWEKYLYSGVNTTLNDLKYRSNVHQDELSLIFVALHRLVNDNTVPSNLKSGILDLYNFALSCIKTYTLMYNTYSNKLAVIDVVVKDNDVTVYTYSEAFTDLCTRSKNGADLLVAFGDKYKRDGNMNSITVDTILEEEGMYMASYKKYTDIKKIDTANKKINNTITSIKLNYKNIYNNVLVKLESYLKENSYNKLYFDLVNDVLNNRVNVCIEKFVFKLFSSMYPKVGKFLKEMENLNNDNNLNLTPVEVATMVTVDFIIDDVLEHIQFDKLDNSYKV